MDGIAESAAIGITLIGGVKTSAALVAAVFLSSALEGLSSASGMKRAGRTLSAHILALLGGVMVTSAAAALLGYLFLAGLRRT